MAIIGVALARDADTAQRVVLTFTCHPSTTVGNVCAQDLVTPNFVFPLVNNSTSNHAIGVCQEKINATTCRLLILGVVTGWSGLTTGAKLFLSTSGTLVTTKPATGFAHNLGVALSSTEGLFVPNNIRVMQS